MRLTLLALLLSMNVWGQTTANWTNPWTGPSGLGTTAQPGYNNYLTIWYDPVSQKTLLYGIPSNSISIYSGTVYDYDSSAHTWQLIAGASTLATADTCQADTPTQPGDRHPVGQMAIDTLRSRLWITGGVNQTPPCNTNPPGNNSSPRLDLYYLSLNSNPTTDTWTQVNPAHFPTFTGAGGFWDTNVDCWVLFGHDGGAQTHDTWIYCPTNLNPMPGTLTTKQANSGGLADDFAEVTTTCTGADCTNNHPPGVFLPAGGFDTVTNKGYFFGGVSSGLSTYYNLTFSYDAQTKTYTERCSGGCTPPPVELGTNNPGQAAFTYVSTTHNFFYHQNDNTGSPADWVYNPVADTWTKIASTGNGTSGTTVWQDITFDASQNKIIGWNQAPGGGTQATVWEAALTASPIVLTTLNVQAAHVPGDAADVSRTNAPFCLGLPIADSAGITNAQTLGSSTMSAAQFRTLLVWPSGNIKSAQVCGIQGSYTAGGTPQQTITRNDTGNFGGANLATDPGGSSPISVSTGTATFSIKKANFNVIDVATVGATNVVLTSASANRGLVLMGPSPTATFPANVTCGTGAGQSPCTVQYSSANDPSSTSVIDENGPVKAVIKTIGNFVDNASHVYMQYMIRQTFWKNRNTVETVCVCPRNANYSTAAVPSADAAGGTYNTAAKGFASLELRIAPNISGTLNYTLAKDSGTDTGTVSGSDSAYLYQGQTDGSWDGSSAEACAPSSACANTYTTDSGWHTVKNAVAITNGANTTFPAGWADISNGSGVGVSIGVYELAANYPKSLEFNGGGADVRIGLYPSENGAPTSGPGNGTFFSYAPWPQWHIDRLWMEFHATTPASIANDFQEFQQALIARAPLSYYNSSGVFPYRIVDPTVEDNFYMNLGSTVSPQTSNGLSDFCWMSTTPCTPDRQFSSPAGIFAGNNMNVGNYRNWVWSTSGPPNQEEYRWSDMQRFLGRGQTGRWVNSSNFYYFLAQLAWPHTDGTSSTDSTVNGFTFRSRPQATQANAELDNFGRPALACGGDYSGCTAIQNHANTYVNWWEALHFHWYGILDYYMLTGDETIKDSVFPVRDWYLNNRTYQGAFNGSSNDLGNTRAYGIQMMSAARFSAWLAATGDATDAPNVLAQAATNWTVAVKPDVCVRPGPFPSGCTAPPINNFSGADPEGVSKVRGMHQAGSARAQGWCPAATGPNLYRIQQPFEQSILMEGLRDLINTEGSGWSDYKIASDVLYGMSQWGFLEAFHDDGLTHWTDQAVGQPYVNNKMLYEVLTDFATAPCAMAGPGIVSIAGVLWDLNDGAAFGCCQTVGMHFLEQEQTLGVTNDWKRKFNVIVTGDTQGHASWPPDFGAYQFGALIDAIANPPTITMQGVAFTCSNCSGATTTYTLNYTAPSGCVSMRAKWSPLQIAPFTALLGFNPDTVYNYSLSPSTFMTWFGANTVATEPSCGSGSVNIATGTTGLGLANFAITAMAPTGSSGTGIGSKVTISGSVVTP